MRREYYIINLDIQIDMSQKTITYFKMYCSCYPMALSVNYFSNFNETLSHFEKI